MADELFLQPDTHSTTAAEPTPRPLRIHKSGSPQPSEHPAQQWAGYNIPPSGYGAPTSPPPTGPLPYPDERIRKGGAAAGDRRAPSRTATPGDVDNSRIPSARPRKASMSSDASSGAGSGAARRQRPRFDANDPNRPTVSGYGTSSPVQGSKLAERRGAPAKSIWPESPGGPETPDKDEDDGLFQRAPNRNASASAAAGQSQQEYQQQFYPPPLSTTAPAVTTPASTLHIPNPSGVNRLSSTASNATTRASRGSPPPPETPIDPSGGPTSGLSGIEARYAASGIPGTGTLNELQAQSAAAAARRSQYESPQPQRGTADPMARHAGTQSETSEDAGARVIASPPVGGRWSPTERPGSAQHGPPVTFQGVEEVGSPAPRARQTRGAEAQPAADLTVDVSRLGLGDEPPPAYSPPIAGTAASQYPNEKGRYANPSPTTSATGQSSAGALRQHPAFANDPQSSPSGGVSLHGVQHNGGPHGVTTINTAQANKAASPGPAGQGPASPPPLPEGWIAHLDNNSGQYYYIHLPTQSTQWEFPKGPTPLNLEQPMSPVGTFVNPLASPSGSVFKQPLASPGFGPVPQSAAYDRQSIMSMNSIASPTAAGFTGPPPSAGVDMYRIAPTNGVYFGPYLRYTNMDLERGLWLGSIMLITDAAQPPTIHLHQSTDLSPNPRQLKAHPIHSHQRWIFYRYDVDVRMEEHAAAKWTYAITSHLGCTRYEFLIAGQHEQSWRWIAHSGNDFAMNVSANDRTKLGGVGLMWRDVLLKHQECGGFHTQVGLGGQIYADRLWKDIPQLRQWTQTSGKENRKNAPWSAKLDEDVTHAYFHYYTSHFDQPAVREAFAQIPQVSCLDDHDIFDGYGSYPEYMQQSNVFKNLGRIGIEMYLLFQHHTTFEILRNVSNDIDLFTITGQGWHFVKYFGPSVVVVGPDTRSERSTNQVMAGPTYQGIFPKVAVLPPSVQHCIWLLPVPIVYPRLEAVEQMASTVATGKKVVTGSFNALGRITGGVAGIVGAKGVVNSGFDGVKKAIGKSGLMQGVLSPFGEVEVLDELRDLWTHESKDLERTYILRTLQGISHNKSLRMTFLSGSVGSCGAGLVHDPSRPSDHKTMYQLITAPIVNAPTPSYILRLLHNSRQLYIPANGTRSTPSVPTDTKEDMMEIFAADVDGRAREHRRLMGRRNYLAVVAYDPELVQGQFGTVVGNPEKGGGGRLSLAADFMVQSEGQGMPMKYGPVIVPSLEYGR